MAVNTANKNMKKETKQTLISLSLAGTIGYYLYNKLAEAGLGIELNNKDYVPAKERTAQELAWRPVENTCEEPEQVLDLWAEPEEQKEDDYVLEPVPQLQEETVGFDELADNILEPMDNENTPTEAIVEETSELTEESMIFEISEEQNVQDELFVEPMIPTVEDAIPMVEPAIPTVEELLPTVEESVEDPSVEPITESTEDIDLENNSDELLLDTPVLETPEFEAPTLDFDALSIDTPELKKDEGAEPKLDLDLDLDKLDETQTELDLENLVAEPVLEPTLEPMIEVEPETVAEPVVESVEEEKGLDLETLDTSKEDLDLEHFGDIKEDEKETSADDLFNAMDGKPIMENTEPLHKVDEKDTSAKQEFKNIMDFFKTL